MTLWIEQRGLCWICAKPMNRFTGQDDPLGVSRDHILPRSRGGKSATRNYLLAHRWCNSERKNPNLIGRRQAAQVIKRDAIARLRQSVHWVEDYQDHGAYRGSAPPVAADEATGAT
jgi:5-methylcytosine-specific restriction endonuclease McrA